MHSGETPKIKLVVFSAIFQLIRQSGAKEIVIGQIEWSAWGEAKRVNRDIICLHNTLTVLNAFMQEIATSQSLFHIEARMKSSVMLLFALPRPTDGQLVWIMGYLADTDSSTAWLKTMLTSISVKKKYVRKQILRISATTEKGFAQTRYHCLLILQIAL